MIIRSLFVFAAAFAGGALLALAARSAWFRPEFAMATADQHQPAPQPMVHNHAPAAMQGSVPIGVGTQGSVPTASKTQGSVPTQSAADNADAANPSPRLATADGRVLVNTVCPICAMEVDVGIEPAAYAGQWVGFGCRACPPRFAREPGRYGPSALRNEVAGN
jgi:hypothetical protein